MSVRGRLLEVPSLKRLLPLIRSVYARRTSYIWDDAASVQHQKHQAEGGDCSSVIHEALKEADSHLEANESLCAFLDDVYVVTLPKRTRPVCELLTTICKTMAGIQLHAGKSRAWNLAGQCHEEVEELGEDVSNPGGLEILETPWD